MQNNILDTLSENFDNDSEFVSEFDDFVEQFATAVEGGKVDGRDFIQEMLERLDYYINLRENENE